MLAWETGGASWDIGQLRDITTSEDVDLRKSFSTAFADTLAVHLVERVVEVRIDTDVIEFTAVPGLPEKTSGTSEIVCPFAVTFEGDGNSHLFDLEFHSSIENDAIGKIPVLLNGGYIYKLRAEDPDGHYPLTFVWTAGSDHHGATLTADGVLTWPPLQEGPHDFSVTVFDCLGASDEYSWTVNVRTINQDANDHAPTILDATPPSAMAWRDWEFQIEASDLDEADQDTLIYHLTEDRPTGMTIDPRSGLVRWNPMREQVGEHSFTVRVGDQRGKSSERTFAVTVVPPSPMNRAPSLEPILAIQSALVDETYTYPLQASDPDGDPLAFKLVHAPAAMLIHETRGEIAWKPSVADVGTWLVVVQVTDKPGAVTRQSFYLDVFNPNDPPQFHTLELAPAHLNVGYEFSLDVRDPNEYPIIAYEIVRDETDTTTTVPATSNLQIDANGRLTWTPREADIIAALGAWPPSGIAELTIKISATNLFNASGIMSYSLRVSRNASPIIDASPATVPVVGQPWTYTFTVTDPDGDAITLVLEQSPVNAGLVLRRELAEDVYEVYGDEAGEWVNGVIEVTGLASGDYELYWLNPGPVHSETWVRVWAIDENPHSPRWQRFTLSLPVFDSTSIPPSRPPHDPSASMSVVAGTEFRYHGKPSASAGMTLSYELFVYSDEQYQVPWSWSVDEEQPTIAGGADNDFWIQWTPEESQINATAEENYYFKVVVSADVGWYPSLQFAVHVVAPQTPPRIVSSDPPWATVGHEWVYQPETDRENAEGLLWYLDACPDAMLIHPDTGRITWTPEATLISQRVDVQVRVVDPATGDGWVQCFPLMVYERNAPPSIDTTFPTIWPLDEPFVFDVLARDPEDRPLIYRLLDANGNPLSEDYDVTISETGLIQWDSPIEGEHTFLVRVEEKHQPDSFAERTFSLLVVNGAVNREPIVRNLPNRQFASIGDVFTHQFDVDDPDTPENDPADAFAYHILAEDPLGRMTVDSGGLFSWDLEGLNAGVHTAAVRISDSPTEGSPASTIVYLTIEVVDNKPPQVADPRMVYPILGQQFTYDVAAIDPEGQLLTFAIDPKASGLPADIRIDRETGFLWWEVPRSADELPNDGTPDDDTWTYDVPVLVSDPYGATSKHTLTIVVSSEDTIAPTVSYRIEDGNGAIVLPGEDLNVNGKYYLIVDVSDNLGREGGVLDENTGKYRFGELTIIDVAMFEVPNEYRPVVTDLLHGTTWYDFTVGGLNPGYVRFHIAAEDAAGNETNYQFAYYVTDNSNEPPAKIDGFVEPLELGSTEEPVVVAMDASIASTVEIHGIASMAPYTYSYDWTFANSG